MAINYIEKGIGLHDTIIAAGHWLHFDTARGWVASDEKAVQPIIDAYPLDNLKAVRQDEVRAYAKGLKDKALANVSSGEVAWWATKLTEAKTYGSSKDPVDAPMLSAEALSRGISLDDLVLKVQANAEYFQGLEQEISAYDGKHRDTIASMQTFEDVLNYDITAGWPAI
jgi:hypothetical protein